MSSELTDRPEEMGEFFDRRHEGYDAHMRRSVVAFDAFYGAIAGSIPRTESALEILDVGCGTGLEMEPILRRAPNARITGIDLSAKMLSLLREKFADRMDQITAIQGSYLTVDLGRERYDYVVSVMTLHHLLPDQKRGLYARIRRALKLGGAYIEGDYVVSESRAQQLMGEYREAMATAAGAEPGSLHIDIPFSMATQRALLLEAGFDDVVEVWQEGEARVYEAVRGAG